MNNTEGQPRPQVTTDFGNDWDALDEEAKRIPDEPVAAADGDSVGAEVQEATEGQEAAQGNEPDEIDLPAEVRARIEAAERRAMDAEHRAKSDAGRQAALQQQLQELKQQMGKQTAEQSMADLESIKEDYPEIAAPLEKALKSLSERFEGEIESRLSRLSEQIQPLQMAQQQQYINEQMSRLEQEMPGWQETVRTDHFRKWMDEQHDAVRALAASPNANDALTALRMYQSAAKPADDKPRRPAAQQAAVLPASNRAAPRRSTQPPDEFDAAWDHYDRAGR